MQLDLGPGAWAGPDLDGPAVPLHPLDDRVGDPPPVLGNRGEIEAGAAVANEPIDLVVLDLDVDGDVNDAGVLGGIEDGLVAGCDEGPEIVVHLRVADHNSLDLQLMGPFEATGHRVDGVVQAHAMHARGTTVQPGAEVALLRPGEGHHLPGFLRALDEGKGLEHRIVEVGGHLGPCLGPDPGRPFLDQVIGESPEPRPGQQGEPTGRDEDGEDDVGRRGQGRRRGQEDDHPAEDQQRAGDQARPRLSRPKQGFERRPDRGEVQSDPTLLTGSPRPEDREPDRGEGHRPGDPVAEPEAAEPQDDQDAGHEQATAEQLAGGGPRDVAPRRGGGRIDGLGRRQDPQEQVHDDAEARGERQDDESESNHERVEPEVLGHAPGDTGEHAVAAAPPQCRTRRAGLDSAGRELELGHRADLRTGVRPDSIGDHPEMGSADGQGPGSGMVPMVATRDATDDVCMTTEQPEPATAPGAGAATGAAARPVPARYLRRRTSDRVIGGVAAGLGDYLNVDPILIRVAFAGLMIFGGAGLVLYVLGWVLIPALGETDSIAQTSVRLLARRTGRLGALIFVVAAVIVLSPWLSNRFERFFIPMEVFWAFAIALIGLLLLLPHDGVPGTAASAPPPDTTAGWAPQSSVAASTAGVTTMTRRRPRERSPLGWYVVGVTLLAIGVLAVVDNVAAVRILPGQYAGAGLLVLGIGLFVAAWWGRARLLILLGLLILPIAAISAFLTVPLEGGIADTEFQPRTLAEVQPAYRLVAGVLRIDLTQLDAGSTPVTIDASVGVGEIFVIVPREASVQVTGTVQGGRLLLFGHRQVGTGLTDHVTGTDPGPRLDLVLNLDAGLGQVEVERSTIGGY